MGRKCSLTVRRNCAKAAKNPKISVQVLAEHISSQHGKEVTP